ncbi:MAG: hypothetical protein SFY66_15765 [Oculatellaceae cyanobacterium bins.114]|nr:hypothetical protein [Oculatellaceae cyanobacterium bins.114]
MAVKGLLHQWEGKIKVSDVAWSDSEKKIAQEVFRKAYEREISALIKEVREQASTITELDEMWRLHDFLSARRHELDGKYDYRYSVLVFVFATLVREGWLHLDELKGLDADKLTKVAALTRI